MRATDKDILSQDFEQKLSVCCSPTSRPQQLGTPALESTQRMDSTWFPPFNQVTQAWNAQLCQTQATLDA